MCSRTSARRDRRSAMMFHYIDYADTAVRTRNRQKEGNRDRERGQEHVKQTERWRVGEKQIQTKREDTDRSEHRETERV